MKKLRVAVIGAGNMGKNHIRTWHKLAKERDGIEFLGIADPMPQSQELAKQYQCRWYAQYQDLIEELKPDAVSCVVPTFLHKEVGIYLIGQGIHTLIEKPIAATILEAQALISAERKAKNTTVMVGHIEWFNPVVQKARHLLKQGVIGTPYSMIAKRMKNKSEEGNTNVILELGIHDVHLICALLERYNKPKVHASGQLVRFQKQEDTADIKLDFGNASASIFLSWASPKNERSLEIFGTKGCLKLDYIKQEIEVNLLEDSSSWLIDVPRKEPLQLEIEAFVDTIKGKIKNPVPTTAAANALDICTAAIMKIHKDKR